MLLNGMYWVMLESNFFARELSLKMWNCFEASSTDCWNLWDRIYSLLPSKFAAAIVLQVHCFLSSGETEQSHFVGCRAAVPEELIDCPRH